MLFVKCLETKAHKNLTLILLAAGTSSRYRLSGLSSSAEKSADSPFRQKNFGKQFALVKNFANSSHEERPIYLEALSRFWEQKNLLEVVIVVPSDLQKKVESETKRFVKSLEKNPHSLKIKITSGKNHRHLSVFEGLKKASPKAELVLIHDSARPAFHPEDLRTLMNLIKKNLKKKETGFVPSEKVVNTIKSVDSEGYVKNHLNRNALRQVSTPQCFPIKSLKKTYITYLKKYPKAVPTDDAQIYAHSNFPIKIFPLKYPNPKLTHAEDFLDVEKALKNLFSQK